MSVKFPKDYQEILKVVAKQEKELQFAEFTNETALTLGLALIEKARRKEKGVTIDITRNRQQLFHYAFPGTSPDNDQWIIRKNRVVNYFHKSSYYLAIYLKSLGRTLEEKYFISSRDYAACGGAFPITIKKVGVVGTITVSGLADHEDHLMVVETIKEYLEGRFNK
jgi:uncharacterized protein (UPF0303 family)